jgi:Family of unknown function (DUF6512)
MEKITKWIIIGIIFTCLVGSILHFGYSLTGWLPIGLFAPVNESPWEHLKLSFWPIMLILIFEYFFLYRKEQPNNSGLARTVGILLMPVIILGVFYLYTSILGTEILIVDILTFYAAVIIGQLVSLRIYHMKPISVKINKFAPIALLAFAAILIIFTFFPPHLPPFYDHNIGGYGIPP